MTHFNLMDNARRGILAEFVFSNLAFVSALVVNKTDTGFNNRSFLFIRKKYVLLVKIESFINTQKGKFTWNEAM